MLSLAVQTIAAKGLCSMADGCKAEHCCCAFLRHKTREERKTTCVDSMRVVNVRFLFFLVAFRYLHYLLNLSLMDGYVLHNVFYFSWIFHVVLRSKIGPSFFHTQSHW